MRDWIAKFRGWKDASLLRRVVVTVAGFVMLSCVSIGTMSVVAVGATRAVFKPAEVASPTASGRATSEVASDAPPPSGPLALKKGPKSRAAKPKTDTADSAGDNE